jgi:hypothetical protein
MDNPYQKIRASPVNDGHHELKQKADVSGTSRENLNIINIEMAPLDEGFLGLIF